MVIKFEKHNSKNRRWVGCPWKANISSRKTSACTIGFFLLTTTVTATGDYKDTYTYTKNIWYLRTLILDIDSDKQRSCKQTLKWGDLLKEQKSVLKSFSEIFHLSLFSYIRCKLNREGWAPSSIPTPSHKARFLLFSNNILSLVVCVRVVLSRVTFLCYLTWLFLRT